ncbi:MAG: efflux RND transporter periplasmic adaptor subunit [Candidatus Zixiibacteriota bacterium]|nr:MAG: efflux RND transporter periplasmic adaptor subunit [candidate division Zixibacteria bacterium]
MNKKKKLWLIIGGAAVFILIIVLAVGKDSGMVYSVQSGKVEKGEIVSLVTATGSVQARTTVKISADVAAKIIELPVKEGDQVKKGDVLVRLDQTRYQAAVSQYDAALAAARSAEKRSEASLLEAKQTYDRGQKLYAAQLISEENQTQLQTALDVAKANLESSQYYTKQQKASLEEIKDNFNKTVIKTPIDGTITALNAEIGEIVMVGTMNNAGTVIMTVADLSTIEVEVNVDETDIARVRVDQEAKIELDALPDTSFKGIVTEVGNAAQNVGTSGVTNFTVKILLLEKVEGIKPGMTSTVDITTDKRNDVLYVPIQAVVMRPDKSDSLKKGAGSSGSSGGAVAATVDSTKPSKKDDKKQAKELEGIFKVSGDVVKFVPIKTGIADQQNIEIKEGLAENEEIVTGSYKILRTIEDGAKVKVSKEIVKEEKNN